MGGRLAVIGRTLLVGIAVAAIAGDARSQDRGAWFRGLRQPGTRIPCCDEADCHRTEADWRGGRWWAIVEGRWVPVPRNKIITDVPSLDGDAYICTSTFPSFIFCFVPPVMAM